MIIIFTVLWLVFFDTNKKDNNRYRIKTLRYDARKKKLQQLPERGAPLPSGLSIIFNVSLFRKVVIRNLLFSCVATFRDGIAISQLATDEIYKKLPGCKPGEFFIV